MRYFTLIALLLAAPLAHALDRSVIDASGLPIPRFVSLRSNDVNMRVGPGKQYPIRWNYQRKGLPVEVVEEFGHWRHVRDLSGEKGWIHKNLLSGHRYAITQDEPTLFYLAPRDDAAVIVQAAKGTLVRMTICESDWCALTVSGRTGWAPKSLLWGVYANEQFKKK